MANPPDAPPSSGEAGEQTSTVEDAAAAAQLFPVVGIGASAGGLEALDAFFRRLSVTGMAFVVVQHLAPDRESNLVSILARSTAFPVEQAEDNQEVQHDRVYVIPPGVNLAMLHGRLHLIPFNEGLERVEHPVDFFFRSLAEDRGSRSIGVVLSGTGIDGERGLQDIRAAGGLSFVQDPNTAQFSGMPQGALESGAADAVLSPEGIAEELLRISKHPYLARPPPPQQKPQEGLNKLFVLIRSAFGTDLSLYKYATVQRRVERRMALNKIERLDEYVRLVLSNSLELNTLYRDLLINVTSFFRDAEPFEALRELVFPRILERKKSADSIRIWVPGCSTGEEAYSIAIVLLEALGERAQQFRLQIFATDLDEEAVARARQGVYPVAIAADVTPERLRRFFQRKENGYEVSRRVRDIVVFATHDLTRDAPFSRLDLCSCRNVLIYLQAPLQKRVLRVIHYALGPNGFLLLGNSETVGDAPELFSMFDKKNRIYLRKNVPAAPAFELGIADPREVRTDRRPPPEGLRPLVNLQQIADRKILERFGPAGVLVNENLDIIQFRGRTGAYLEPSPGTATLSLLKIARPELHLELRTATHKALTDNVPATAKNIRFMDGEVSRSVTLEVSPLKEPETGSRCLLVLFVEEETPPPAEPATVAVAPPAPDDRVEELERELVGTKEYLQSAIEELETSNEELKSANEELQSSNEELQSTNEELETSKEELQSTNEELTTVNDELQNRMEELSVSNDDLQNLLGAAETTVIIVGMDLRLRRLTYAAERLLGLSTDDLNRPVSVLKAFTGRVDVERICRQVIDRLTPVQEDFQGVDGRWYHLRVHAYRTTDHVIGGAVLSLIDIDARRRGEGGDHSGLAAFPEAVLILDDRFKVAWANARSAELFAVPVQELLGGALDGLGGGRLAQPELRSALERVVNQRTSFADLFLPSRNGQPEVWASGAPLADDGRFGFRVLLSFHSHRGKAPP